MSDIIQTPDFDFKKFEYIDIIEHTLVNVPAVGSTGQDSIDIDYDFVPIVIGLIDISWNNGITIMPARDYALDSSGDYYVYNGYVDLIVIGQEEITIDMAIGNDGTVPVGDTKVKLLIFRESAEPTDTS